MSRVFHYTRFWINGSKQAVVVDNAAAQTHFLYDIKQMRLAVFIENGDEAHGVNGVGIKLFQSGVLLDVILKNAKILFFKIIVKLVKALVIAYFYTLAAVTAFEVLHLAEQVFSG